MLPFRIVVFATQFANLALISTMMRPMTGSPLAGLVAPVLWLASPVIYLPMTWNSPITRSASFCYRPFFYSAPSTYRHRSKEALYRYVGDVPAWIRGIRTERCVSCDRVFVYGALCSPVHAHRCADVLGLVAYTLWHRSIGQSLSGGVYAMDFHPQRMLWAFGKYLWLAVSAAPAARLHEFSLLTSDACSIAALISIAVALAVLLWKRLWLGAFFGGWFVLTLAPYLPLADHIRITT